MTVLIAGATGMVGGALTMALAGEGAAPRALVRPTSDGRKREELESAGVEIVEGDLNDAESLARACRGVDAVVSTVSAMPFSWADGNTIDAVDRDGQIRLIDAAERASVSRFVLVSFLHEPGNDFPLDAAKVAAERHLRASGMEHVILQANFFMEIWLSPAFGFDYGTGSATVFGDGSNRISWVSFSDVARACRVALSQDAAKNRTWPVGGPEAMSPLDVVRAFERISGSPWKVERVPVDVLERQKEEAPDEVQKSVAGLQISYASGRCAMDPTLYLVRDGLKSIDQYARQTTTS